MPSSPLTVVYVKHLPLPGQRSHREASITYTSAGTPTPIIALGAVFSALEVIPLALLGFETAQNMRTLETRRKGLPLAPNGPLLLHRCSLLERRGGWCFWLSHQPSDRPLLYPGYKTI